MITHDSNFETLAKANIKQTDVTVVKQVYDLSGYYDDTPFWTSSNYLMDVKIDAVGQMLGTATKKATVKLIGIQENVAVGDIFKISIGIDEQNI